MTTTTDPIQGVLSAPIEQSGSVDSLAEQLLALVASESVAPPPISYDDLIDRQSQRVIRPLLACLARKSSRENGTEYTPYGGTLSFVRPGKSGPVRVTAEFENSPGKVRLAFQSPRPATPAVTAHGHGVTPMESAFPIDDVIETLREAWVTARPIVPLVGAGLSAESGFPILNSVVRYFAKFHQYLESSAFLPDPDKLPPPTKRLGDWAEDCKKRPWKYVEEFDWPDWFELNQDLLFRLEDRGLQKKQQLVEDSIRTGQSEILKTINPDGDWWFKDLKESLVKALPGHKGLIESQFFTRDGRHVAWDMIGDWKRLIHEFTNYHGDYADALFVKLAAGRQPNTGHRFLAFLVKLLSIRTVLTFNFDEFIEQALALEDITPRVFAMEEGRGIPHHSLVRDAVSVVKLHGSNHSLLLDERVDHPLTDGNKQRFDRLVGADPLLLVLGCSGSDYRLRDLIKHVVGVKGKRSTCRVVWLHFEETPPPFLKELDFVRMARTNNPGATLQHIYYALAGRHPASTNTYATDAVKPVLMPGRITPDAKKEKDWACEVFNDSRSFMIFSTLDPSNAEEKCYPVQTAAKTLVDLSNHGRRQGYHVIWIDLEAVHTLAAVVGSLIDQCRKYDPALAPTVLPLDDGDQCGGDFVIDLAVDRVRQAIRRGKYLVLFDGLEAYPWPPTTHHGGTSYSRRNEDTVLERLKTFFAKLEPENLGDSKILLAIDPPKTRSRDVKHEDEVAKFERLLSNLTTKPTSCSAIAGCDEKLEFTDIFEFPTADNGAILTTILPGAIAPLERENPHTDEQAVRAMILHTLCCFRRPRSLAALRHLLKPILGQRDYVDRAITLLTQKPGQYGAVRLEGGWLWFNRPVRDRIYRENSRSVNRSVIDRCLHLTATDNEFCSALCQSFQLSTMHQRISRQYFTRTFVQSDDTFAFLEHVYHRMSSIRYLAKIIGLVKVAEAQRSAGNTRWTILLCKSIEKCGDLLRKAVGNENFENELLWRMEIKESTELARLLRGDPPASGEMSELIAQLEERHLDEIRSLWLAWMRAETSLRAQQPAEQLKHWCDVLLRDDLDRRCNKILTLKNEYFLFNGECLVNPRAEPVVEQFRRELTDFRVKLQIERSDFADAIDTRLKLLFHEHELSRADAFFAAIDRDVETLNLIAPCKLDHIHALLDISLCRIRQAEQKDDPSLRFQARKINDWIKRKLEEYKKDIHHLSSDPARAMDKNGGSAFKDYRFEELASAVSDFEEARLRLQNMIVEAAFKVSHIFSRGFLGRKLAEIEVSQQEAGNDDSTRNEARSIERNAVSEGLILVRSQDTRAKGPLRSAILEPSPDGSFYAQYRSNFHTLRGRVEWLEAFSHQGDPARKGEVVAAKVEESFSSAFRMFDLGRGGLGKTNRILVARNELCMVEACLAYSRIVLHPENTIPNLADPSSRLKRAAAKYEAARSALQRAQTCFLAGRRNVVWWKLFFQLVAQYQADRFLHELCQFSIGPRGPGQRSPTAGQFLVRLRRGYAAIRSALDYRLAGQSDATHLTGWLKRTWWELTLASFRVGCWLCARDLLFDDSLKEEKKPTEREQKIKDRLKAGADYVIEMLKMQNKRAGLPETGTWPDYLSSTIPTLGSDSVIDMILKPLKIEQSTGHDDLDGKSENEEANFRRELLQCRIQLLHRVEEALKGS